MLEVGAGIKHSNQFLQIVDSLGIDAALAANIAPPAAREFMRTTFDCLASGKPHVVMASLAVGREHIIPDMFRALLRDMAIEESAAPAFHYYLHRHVPMLAFVLQRLIQAVIVMVVAFIAFMLFQYVGDPVVFLLGQDAKPDKEPADGRPGKSRMKQVVR